MRARRRHIHRARRAPRGERACVAPVSARTRIPPRAACWAANEPPREPGVRPSLASPELAAAPASGSTQRAPRAPACPCAAKRLRAPRRRRPGAGDEPGGSSLFLCRSLRRSLGGADRSDESQDRELPARPGVRPPRFRSLRMRRPQFRRPGPRRSRCPVPTESHSGARVGPQLALANPRGSSIAPNPSSGRVEPARPRCRRRRAVSAVRGRRFRCVPRDPGDARSGLRDAPLAVRARG